MKKTVLYFSLLLINWIGFAVSNDDIVQKMEANGVVPDVIDKAPSEVLEVTYFQDKTLSLGNELTPTEVKDQPLVKWIAQPDTYYTLIMVDPDAPSRENPSFSLVNHWLVGNILGANIDVGETVTEYLGSGPPKGTGLHRYIFLVYKQENKITFDEPKTTKTSRAHRLMFSLKKFTEKYNLGQPVAGNFFQAQWDAYVDERNKNISG